MPQSKPDYQAIAKENDVNLDEVKPLSAEARIAILELNLASFSRLEISVTKRLTWLSTKTSKTIANIVTKNI